MDIILLERVAKLGQMGDTVRVRDGYARNYLLPQGKALRANKANLARFENERAQLEARNLERKAEAEAVAEKLNGKSIIVIRAAGETGQLYGSVATRDIATQLGEGVVDGDKFDVVRSQVSLRAPIKTIGLHEVVISLHPEVDAVIAVNVARSTDEANRQAAGEDLTVTEQDEFEFEEDLEDEAEGEEAEVSEEEAEEQE
ncbi:50S ribosomal protein L9 [Rhodobacteraceae bacterium RKSG542]|uniref:50S ribosomal protein L9 n=1 Tax=Pseudovibrio flavus TaxID=2529854 RepID=UPI0012BC6AB8|nr:50S ribosomal protein L9 [Pseudovibrio flavus]MTI17620.1 50S ribosomal protein L9 [Pseudovibrio flavus]